MAPASPSEVLKKLPKNTPPWAVGLVSLVVAVAVCLIGIFVFARPEIKSLMDQSAKAQADRTELQRDSMDFLFDLTKTNTKQISELSGSLLKAQDSNIRLSERVASMEKEVAETNASLKGCQDALKKCKK